jgi:GTP-binding nuclear protein Ran
MDTFLYNIEICGPSGCGKSAFMRKHCDGRWFKEPQHVPNAEIVFKTNRGVFVLNIQEGVMPDADARIVMFVSPFIKYLKEVEYYLDNCDTPKVICLNMCDKKANVYYYNMDLISLSCLNERYNCHVYQTSSKSSFNFEKPFLYLLKILSGHDDLIFT